MFENLAHTQRLLLQLDLSPVQSDRFQPTGFPDIGAAVYELPDERRTRMLLVESAQSMANRLEAAIIGPDNELMAELEGLPYIRVKISGEVESSTNSLIEAHRINSPFIISNPEFKDRLSQEADYRKGKQVNWQKAAAAIFRYDPNSVLHGCFLANLEDGRVRLQRAVSAFIEARDVREVVSGGVKNNPLDPTGKLRADNYDKDVYGNVPYQRVEYTAGKITAFFNLDLGLLRSYALGGKGYELLVALALYKVRRFMETGTRLRTACTLQAASALQVSEPQGFEVPETAALLDYLKVCIKECKASFASPAVTEIATKAVMKKGETKGEQDNDADNANED